MKRLPLLLLLGFLAGSSYGQFYVQPTVGFAFSSNPTEMRSTFITDDQGKSVYTMKLRYGQGLYAGLTAGYCLWDQFFIELDAKKGVLTRNSASIDPIDIRELNNFYMAGFFGEMEHRSPVFQFSPRIGYRVQKEQFGASFSLGPHFMTTKVSQTMHAVNYIIVGWELVPHDVAAVHEYRGGLHTGLQAGLGLSWSFRPDLQLVLDLATVFNNYEITSGEVTFYEVDGVDRLGTLDDTGIEIDPPDNRLNHSYCGVNIGVRYLFSPQSAVSSRQSRRQAQLSQRDLVYLPH